MCMRPHQRQLQRYLDIFGASFFWTLRIGMVGEHQQVLLHIISQEAKEENLLDRTNGNHQSFSQHRSYVWWLRLATYTVFLLAGQSGATLLGRLYFDKGGNSKWMETLVQGAAFAVLIPCYYFVAKSADAKVIYGNPPSTLVLLSIYLVIGGLQAAISMLYSLGLLYLPVSTYSMICASQLAFNALFSFFLNAQKFTPFIINSLVLLTISSILLVFQSESTDSTEVSKRDYAIGFLCTVAASAGYGLILSLTQLTFQKVLKHENLKAVLDLIVYPSLVATCAALVGLFASGEWKGLEREMEGFELGKLPYLMTLMWTAISWQIFNIGCVAIIFEVSSLFSNAISALGMPIVPVLAVFIFQDKVNGVKVMSMVLAIWGFVSYVYQNYLDDLGSKKDNRNFNEVPNDSPSRISTNE
ncbi:purine permease 10 [Tripterygium wilfordii]|uniref:Probable purine permease n=1 Tax=Tripterygium wilfordii TaxID=458696 RepID=A0A7J7CVZ9_TRIWF|nr:purine permease 21-like [Tripterygium wilfordii]KAF5738305.1 purine permease 10 [Tripterygium wilfordii]